jgi:hypothetical protein
MPRLSVGLTVGLLVGWLAGPTPAVITPDTVVVTTPMPSMSSWEDAVRVPTPVIDEMVDWEQVERDIDCLWDLLQSAGVEISMETVWAFGVWADAQGGPCVLTGEGEDELEG